MLLLLKQQQSACHRSLEVTSYSSPLLFSYIIGGACVHISSIFFLLCDQIKLPTTAPASEITASSFSSVLAFKTAVTLLPKTSRKNILDSYLPISWKTLPLHYCGLPSFSAFVSASTFPLFRPRILRTQNWFCCCCCCFVVFTGPDS